MAFKQRYLNLRPEDIINEIIDFGAPYYFRKPETGREKWVNQNYFNIRKALYDKYGKKLFNYVYGNIEDSPVSRRNEDDNLFDDLYGHYDEFQGFLLDNNKKLTKDQEITLFKKMIKNQREYPIWIKIIKKIQNGKNIYK